MKKTIANLTNDEILDNMHLILQRNNLPLKEDKMKIADEKMKKILEDGMINELLSKEEFDKKTIARSSLDRDRIYKRIEFILLKYYYAIYNDTVDLYQKYTEMNIPLGDSEYSNKLYLLNSELRNAFKTEKEYFDFVSKYDGAIRRFYYSLENKDSEERDKQIESFINIIKSDRRYFDRKKGEENRIFRNLITKRNLEQFGEDFLKNATYKQKQVIESLVYNLKPENFQKIKEIIKLNPNYEVIVAFKNEFLESFTVEEIVCMEENVAKMFACAVDEECLKDLIELLKLNPDFRCPNKMINKTVFQTLDIYTLSELSTEAKHAICSLKKGETYKKDIIKIAKKDLKKKVSFIEMFRPSKDNNDKKKPKRGFKL